MSSITISRELRAISMLFRLFYVLLMWLERFWLNARERYKNTMYTQSRKILIENFENQLICIHFWRTYTLINLIIKYIVRTRQVWYFVPLLTVLIIMLLAALRWWCWFWCCFIQMNVVVKRNSLKPSSFCFEILF